MSQQSLFHHDSEVEVHVLYHRLSDSSEDPPKDEWDSLISYTPPAGTKRALYKPGSGEVCAKYLPMSDSDVRRHVYYNYPVIADPGIEDALFGKEAPKSYSSAGQDLYLDLCDELRIAPVRSFYRGLTQDVIDLKYYGVNSKGVYAMALSLHNNKSVTYLDLTGSELNDDACYHLGQMFGLNDILQKLVLSGCKISASGLLRLIAHLKNHSKELLDLSSNVFRDEGIKYLCDMLLKGAVIKRLNLSKNRLTSSSVVEFIYLLTNTNNRITHLNLSTNSMLNTKAMDRLFTLLGSSDNLIELNMSWNHLTNTTSLGDLLGAPKLKTLNLSYNSLSKEAIKPICSKLKSAKALQTLDLSYNKFTSEDILAVVRTMKEKRVKLKYLNLGDLNVTKEFVQELQELQDAKQVSVVHGKVVGDYSVTEPDLRGIVLKRFDYLITATDIKIDIRVFFEERLKEGQFVLPMELYHHIRAKGLQIDQSLLDEFANAFPGPRVAKAKSIRLLAVNDYIKVLFADRPPPLMPVPKVKKTKKKKKSTTDTDKKKSPKKKVKAKKTKETK